jgi:CDGSH-type Zn-finger protein
LRMRRKHQQYRRAHAQKASAICACVESVSKPACACAESNTGLRMRTGA